MHPDFDVDNRPSGTDRTGDACVPGLFIADLPAPPSGHSRPDPPPRRPSRENADRSGCRSRPRRPRARRRNIRRTRGGGADPWAARKVPSDPRPLPASTRDSGRTPPQGGRARRWRPRRIVARCTVAAAYRPRSPLDSSKPTGSVPPDGWTPRHAGCTTSAGRTRWRHARTPWTSARLWIAFDERSNALACSVSNDLATSLWASPASFLVAQLWPTPVAAPATSPRASRQSDSRDATRVARSASRCP